MTNTPDTFGDDPFDERDYEDAKDLREAAVPQRPSCSWCSSPALYDFKTVSGPWGYGCQIHYEAFRLYDTLGTGKGQRLVVEA